MNSPEWWQFQSQAFIDRSCLFHVAVRMLIHYEVVLKCHEATRLLCSGIMEISHFNESTQHTFNGIAPHLHHYNTNIS